MRPNPVSAIPLKPGDQPGGPGYLPSPDSCEWSSPFEQTRQRLPAIAWLLWIVVLGMAARLSLFVRQRASDSFATVDAAAVVEIALVLAALAFVVVAGRLGAVTARVRGTGYNTFGVMLLVGVSSMLWSPLWQYTGYRSVSVLSQFLAVAAAFSFETDFRSAERRLLIVIGAVVLLQWAGILKWWGLGAVFSPVAMHNNTLATSAAMVTCYCIGEFLARPFDPKQRKLLGVLGLLALLAVVLSTSGGSNVATVLGLLTACLLVRRTDLFFLILFVGTLGAMFVSQDDLTSFLLPGKTAGQIATLRGRTFLWAMYRETIMEHFWFGEGYAVSARLSGHYSTNTHNAFFGVLLSVGAVGVFFFAISMFQVGFRLIGSAVRRYPGAVGAAAALLAGLTNSMSKGFLGEGYYPETLVFFAIFAFAALYIVGNSATAYSLVPFPGGSREEGPPIPIGIDSPPVRPAVGRSGSLAAWQSDGPTA